MNRGERQSRIYEVRETVKYAPTDQEIRSHLVNFLLPYQQQLRDAATIHKAVFITQLGDTRDAIIKAGRRPSRLYICATVLENSIQVPIENLSLDFYGKNDRSEFIFWSDIAQGINMIKIPLILGEEYVREYAEEIIQKARQEREEYIGAGLPVAMAAEGYLLMQEEAKEAARILMTEPSGHALVRAAVEWVKQPPQPGRIERIFPANRIPAYVIAGAQLSQLAYELMYPLTENLP